MVHCIHWYCCLNYFFSRSTLGKGRVFLSYISSPVLYLYIVVLSSQPLLNALKPLPQLMVRGLLCDVIGPKDLVIKVKSANKHYKFYGRTFNLI